MQNQINNNLTIEDQLQQALKKLHYEIDFVTKSLDIKSQNFNATLESSILEFETLLKTLENLVEQNKEQQTRISNELTTFTLLPEKITSNIVNIVPQIASKVETIHQSHIIKIKEQFLSLQQEIAKEITNYHSKLAEITNKCLEDSIIISTRSRRKFVTLLAIMVVFSTLVSGITSYFVTIGFPRYVEIKGVNDLSVYDSRVEVWGSVKDQKDLKVNKTK